MHTLQEWAGAAGGIVRQAEESATDPWNGHDTLVIIATIVGIALVVVLIVWAKLHAFLALTIASLFVGLVSGISVEKVTTS
jgi:GntP family gluconate:H+ symporter